MTLFFQRLRVCIRLFMVLIRLVLRGEVSLRDFLKIRKRGNGLCSTFIVGNRVVVKVRNELASLGNRKLYNGKFDGLFFYEEDNKRLPGEFYFYDYLHRQGMSAQPICLTENALVTAYLSSENTTSLSPGRLKEIFELIDRLYELNIFHGDINMGNLLPRKEGYYIIDFESSRFMAQNQRDKLHALDIVIFIEKLYRFHEDMFSSIIDTLRSEIEKRAFVYGLIKDSTEKYLPNDIYLAIFANPHHYQYA